MIRQCATQGDGDDDDQDQDHDNDDVDDDQYIIQGVIWNKTGKLGLANQGWRIQDTGAPGPLTLHQISGDRIEGVHGNISSTTLAKKGKTTGGREIAKSRLAGTSVVQVYLPPNSSPCAGGGDPIKPVVQIY